MSQEEFLKVEEIAGHLKAYVDTKTDQAKFSLAEKTSTIATSILVRIFICTLFIFFLVCTTMALALLIGELVGKLWAGFLIVSGIYSLLGAIVW
jgi:Putative Actinobacterial Holin-X, holin superfamily III